MNVVEEKLALPRYRHIDILRGIAVVLMLNQHIGVWMIDHLKSHPFVYMLNGLGGMAAPLFVTLAGLGTVFLCARHETPDLLFLKRGMIIILSGYLLNFFVSSWFSVTSWYVLHMIGSGFLVTPVLRRLPDWSLLLLIPVTLLVTIATQCHLGTPFHMGNQRMGNASLPGGIFRLIFFEGHFPVFPWLSFFISGIISGRWLIEKKETYIFVSGAMLLFLCILFSFLPYVLGETLKSPFLVRLFKFYPSFYPALTPVTLMLISFSLLGIFLFTFFEQALLDMRLAPLESMGRLSLTILFTHAVVFREGAFRLFLFKKMGGAGACVMIAAVIVGYAVLSWLWKKKSYTFSLEWLLRKA